MSPGAEFFGRAGCGSTGGRSEANVIHSVPAEPQTGKVLSEEERYKAIKRRARLLDFFTLNFGAGKYAIVKICDEQNRYPISGTTSLDEIEGFVRLKEREPRCRFWRGG